MSGTSPTPAEHHLGDRLAALVDGELNHDARERVLSHLATCAKCKAEADAQRRLKNVFAQAAPPPPSEGFLARLQGLSDGPAGPGGDDDGSGGPLGGGRQSDGFFGGLGALSPTAGGPRDPRVPRSGGFGYVPVGSHAAVLPDVLAGDGFRIHEVGRSEQDRSGSVWRGRRFAFAAASAVSLAAIALGGTLPLGSANGARAAGGSNVTPLRSGASAPSSSSAEDRRRGGGGVLAAAPEQPTAPVGFANLSGMPAPSGPVQPLGGAFPAGRLNGSSLPPLIRPAVATLPLTTTDLPAGVLPAIPSATPSAQAQPTALFAAGLPLTARR
ncbi:MULTISPECIES: zf-HC2 domain-containing protein [unclassified Streptomyces]|uniref:anti-sigma factor family protein n=1 Tax=unclassified Streptomyces TaxID=2593676 RepID=UPI00382F80D7